MEPTPPANSGRWELGLADEQARDHTAPAALAALPPVRRGFWLDEELMAVTGIASVAVLKKLQARSAITASHIALPEGGRRRAWSARNVLRASLAHDLSDMGRMSLLAAGALAGVLRANHFDTRFRLNLFFGRLQRALDEQEMLPEAVLRDLESTIPDGSLTIRNGRDVLWSRPGAEDAPIAAIVTLDGPSPEIIPAMQAGHDVLRAQTVIAMQPVISRFLRRIVAPSATE